MTAVKLHTEELFALFDETTARLLQLVSSFAEEEMQLAPTPNAWTAAQISEHIIKSITSLSELLNEKELIAEREPDQRAQELKELFLDFERKFQSPQFVLPTQINYIKDVIISDLKKAVKEAVELRNTVNLFETAEVAGFGILTKLELIHFTIYHTQRHIRQLINTQKSINN